MAEDTPDWKKRLKGLGLSRKRNPAPARPAGPAGSRSTVAVGLEGEDEAARYLERHGVEILARNVREQGSELDIVGLHEGTLVFVEVKRRRSDRFGAPAEAVTETKRKRIVSGAVRWLARNRSDERREIRFDVVTLKDDTRSIEWVPGAFDATDR